jgi:hypothetical protein
VELDPVNERVIVDWPGVGGAAAQCLAVRLTGAADIRVGDRREGHKLDGVDLDFPEADAVATARLNPRPFPQSDRKGDVTGQDVAA